MNTLNLDNHPKTTFDFNSVSFDPYQILFPIGVVHALLGAVSWILYALQISSYPFKSHPHYMTTGFLFSFAAGFLLTAIPRFTGTHTCSKPELAIASSIAIAALAVPHPIFAFLMLSFISIFFARRIRKREYSPPPHFIFLPLGLLMGLTGSLILTVGEFRFVPPSLQSLAKLFLYYGIMLSFLVGIGAKLISALLGWAAPPTHRIEPIDTLGKKTRFSYKKWVVPTVQAVLFLCGFILEAFSLPVLGRSLRAFTVTWIAIQNWRIHMRPRSKGKLAFWIWIGAWSLVVGTWTYALVSSMSIHAAHLIFIGGFGLSTLLVASRVTLAHGGYPLSLETHLRVYGVTSALVILAALTRFTSPWTPNYVHHLGYAALVWVIAITVWSSFFIPRALNLRHLKKTEA